MTARMIASFVFGEVSWTGSSKLLLCRSMLPPIPSGPRRFAVLGSAEGTSCMSERAGLKACERMFWSVKCEKVASRSWVRIWEKGGESIKSEVSSRRLRRGGGIIADEDGRGDDGGDGMLVVAVGGEGDELLVSMLASRRMEDS